MLLPLFLHINHWSFINSLEESQELTEGIVELVKLFVDEGDLVVRALSARSDTAGHLQLIHIL